MDQCFIFARTRRDSKHLTHLLTLEERKKEGGRKGGEEWSGEISNRGRDRERGRERKKNGGEEGMRRVTWMEGRVGMEEKGGK